jgi:hypothetical protein
VQAAIQYDTMAVPKSIVDSKGSWRGKSQLNLPWLPPEKRVTESNSSLHIDTDGSGSFATITYTWAHEGKRQEGTILVCGAHKSDAIEFGWVDSWHQNSSVLHLVGSSPEGGSTKAKGTYSGDGQTWGWTIELVASDGKLAMNMENIPPTGDPMWAVHANYERA